MVGMYNLKYIEGIKTKIHTSVRIQLEMVVILYPPPPSLSLMLPFVFCCWCRRSEFHAIRMQSEFRDQIVPQKQICCSSAVSHAVINLHSFMSALSRLTVQSQCFCVVSVLIYLLDPSLLSCSLLCAVLKLLRWSAAPEESQWNHR